MPSDPQPLDPLRALVEQWRQMYTAAMLFGPTVGDEIGHDARWEAMQFCADELERALAERPAPDDYLAYAERQLVVARSKRDDAPASAEMHVQQAMFALRQGRVPTGVEVLELLSENGSDWDRLRRFVREAARDEGHHERFRAALDMVLIRMSHIEDTSQPPAARPAPAPGADPVGPGVSVARQSSSVFASTTDWPTCPQCGVVMPCHAHPPRPIVANTGETPRWRQEAFAGLPESEHASTVSADPPRPVSDPPEDLVDRLARHVTDTQLVEVRHAEVRENWDAMRRQVAQVAVEAARKAGLM